MRELSLIGTYLKLANRVTMEYKASYIVMIFTSIFEMIIRLFTIWIIIDHVGSLGVWQFKEICFLFGLTEICYSVANTLFTMASYRLDGMVITGVLDQYLVKPVNVLIQIIMSRINYYEIGTALISLILVIYGVAVNINEINIFKIVLIFVYIITGSLLCLAVYIFCGSFSFKYKESRGLLFSFYSLRQVLRYPLDIYPLVIKYVATFLIPLGLVGYYPSLIILNKADIRFDIIMGYLSPIICTCIFILTIKFFYYSMSKYYTSAGS